LQPNYPTCGSNVIKRDSVGELGTLQLVTERDKRLTVVYALPRIKVGYLIVIVFVVLAVNAAKERGPSTEPPSTVHLMPVSECIPPPLPPSERAKWLRYLLRP